MTPEAEFLLATLQGTGVAPPQAIDWQSLLDLADRHGVLPVFSRNFAGQLPETFVGKMRSQWITSAFLASELEGLLGEFRLRGLEVLPLKGPALSEALYGSPTLRPCDDLDLLVQPRDFSRSQSLLMDLGFEPMAKADDYHQTFCRRNTTVELHFAVAPPSSPAMDFGVAWARSRVTEFRKQRIRFFAKPDLLLYLVIHGVKHEFARLIWVLDVARALADLDEGDLDQVFTMARNMGIEGALLTTCELAHRVSHTEMPAQVTAAVAQRPVISTQAALMCEKILNGTADPQTTHQGAGLFVQLEPDARRRWARRLRLFLPSQQDRLWAQRHNIHSRWAPFLRPFRLLLKHGPEAVWRTLFPRFETSTAEPRAGSPLIR
jgi:hypothetical protein